MKITPTFLDEISHDILHQNCGREEWHRNFASIFGMTGENLVIIINSKRC